MQFFDLPSHVARFLSGLCGQSLIWAIGNDPVNAAVCGNSLNNRTLNGTSFSLDHDTIFQVFGVQLISSRWIQPPSLLKLTIRLLFSVVKKVKSKR